MERRSINRYRSFVKSLNNLACAEEKDPADMFVLSGTVQMFNLSFDLSWKVMKDIIREEHGVLDYPVGSPRETLRMAYSVGLIEDDAWLDMLKVRNSLAHDYDGNLAKRYFEVITTQYYQLLNKFCKQAESYMESAEQ